MYAVAVQRERLYSRSKLTRVHEYSTRYIRSQASEEGGEAFFLIYLFHSVQAVEANSQSKAGSICGSAEAYACLYLSCSAGGRFTSLIMRTKTISAGLPATIVEKGGALQLLFSRREVGVEARIYIRPLPLLLSLRFRASISELDQQAPFSQSIPSRCRTR